MNARKPGEMSVDEFKGIGKRLAKGRRRYTLGEMNKTEQAFADELEARKLDGELVWWAFEPFKLRLARLTTYSPDFAVMDTDGTITLYEVKGHWEDDARVKIKVAAERFWMFRFVAMKPRAKKHGGGWEAEEF